MNESNRAAPIAISANMTFYRILILSVSLGLGLCMPALAAEPAAEPLLAATLEAARDWFSARAKGDAVVPPTLQHRAPLTQDQVHGVRRVLWRAYQDSASGRTLAALLSIPLY